MAGQLNPEDYNYFRSRDRQIRTTYDLGKTQNQAASSSARNSYTRNVGDLAHAFGKAWQKAQWGHGARGTANSGIAQQGLGNTITDAWLRPFGNLTGQHQDVQNQFTQADLALARIKGEGIEELEMQKNARLQMEQIAASIRAANGLI